MCIPEGDLDVCRLWPTIILMKKIKKLRKSIPTQNHSFHDIQRQIISCSKYSYTPREQICTKTCDISITLISISRHKIYCNWNLYVHYKVIYTANQPRHISHTYKHSINVHQFAMSCIQWHLLLQSTEVLHCSARLTRLTLKMPIK